MDLSRLGLTDALRATFARHLAEGLEPGRVSAVNRNDLVVETVSGPVRAEPTGRLRHAADSDLDLPAVGDWVAARVVDEGGFAVVTDVLPRSSTLRRRMAGGRSEYQMMAANVDVALVVHAADRPVHARRIERYLVIARDGGIEPLIVLSKADVLAADQRERALTAARELADAVAVSSVAEGGVDALAAVMEAGRTYILLGPSGVGKSTLLNRLAGEDLFATREVRDADHKGRHTTTRRQLVVLPSGALVIDTPGMRELGMVDVQEGIDETFADLAALADGCRFRDCTHTAEAGCAVIAAVEAGEVDRGRYDSWLRLAREAAHYERDYVEQRRRDRAFGKMAREVLKQKRDRR
jgi:ribosome biogenesis GTPase